MTVISKWYPTYGVTDCPDHSEKLEMCDHENHSQVRLSTSLFDQVLFSSCSSPTADTGFAVMKGLVLYPLSLLSNLLCVQPSQLCFSAVNLSTCQRLSDGTSVDDARTSALAYRRAQDEKKEKNITLDDFQPGTMVGVWMPSASKRKKAVRATTGI